MVSSVFMIILSVLGCPQHDNIKLVYDYKLWHFFQFYYLKVPWDFQQIVLIKFKSFEFVISNPANDQ